MPRRRNDLPLGVYRYAVGGTTRYYVKYDRSDGSPATKRGFQTPTAAATWRRDTMTDAARGLVPTAPKTRGCDLIGEWLALRKKHLTPNAYSDYDVNVRLRLKPAEFMRKRVDKITAADVEALQADLYDADELAPKTINNCIGVLSSFLSWCVRKGWATKNVAAEVEPLPDEHYEMDYLRVDEIPRYLEACIAPYRPIAELLIGSGGRISEVLGAEYDDFDFVDGVVRFLRQRRAGAEGKRGGARTRGAARTKGKSFRSVSVARPVIELVGAHRARMSEYMAVGPHDRPFAYYVADSAPPALPVADAARQRWESIAALLRKVHAGELELTQHQIAERFRCSQQTVSIVNRWVQSDDPLRPITRDTISRSWHKQALRKAGLRETLRLHDLRHTAAYVWLQLGGESLSYVQLQLGHRSITTTERYRHLERSHMTERANAADAAIWARLGGRRAS